MIAEEALNTITTVTAAGVSREDKRGVGVH
jgi:hypothetical protein